MNKKEFLKEKLMQLLFGWDCHPYWYKIAHVIELFIMDAFVDLFITLCIVVNTAFMALDHADMNLTLIKTLKYGNYVSPVAYSLPHYVVLSQSRPLYTTGRPARMYGSCVHSQSVNQQSLYSVIVYDKQTE